MERLQALLDRAIAEYADNNPRSRQMFERAKESLPGGNTRTGVYYPPFPIYAERGEGVHLIDLDGHRLLDFVNNNTALILGHAHPAVVEALQNQIAGGTGFSRPLPLEVELAELLRARMPSLERLRFASSGTEAVLNALRVARAFTGRNKVAKFEGAYHGVDEYAMVSFVPPVGPELGPPDRPRPYPSSAGITPAAVDQVIILPFNDPDACEAIISEHADDLAAVIVDPLSTGAGMTLPADGFLAKLREIADRAGVLLIFDEIISFRVARGGAQERFGVRPDLACMGKVVAGGTPGSVFGGRADVMAQYDPATGDPGIQQSGTYNANPIAMVAGLTTLRLLTPEAYEKLDAITQRLGSELESVFAEADLVAQVTTVGSLFRVHFLPGRPRNYREAAREDASIHRWLFFALLARGVYWKQGGNVSLPMEDAHIDQLISAIRSALGEL